jgi:hypothetical protein
VHACQAIARVQLREAAFTLGRHDLDR